MVIWSLKKDLLNALPSLLILILWVAPIFFPLFYIWIGLLNLASFVFFVKAAKKCWCANSNRSTTDSGSNTNRRERCKDIGVSLLLLILWVASIFLVYFDVFYYIFGEKFHCAGLVGFSFHHSQHCCQFLSLHCT